MVTPVTPLLLIIITTIVNYHDCSIINHSMKFVDWFSWENRPETIVYQESERGFQLRFSHQNQSNETCFGRWAKDFLWKKQNSMTSFGRDLFAVKPLYEKKIRDVLIILMDIHDYPAIISCWLCIWLYMYNYVHISLYTMYYHVPTTSKFYACCGTPNACWDTSRRDVDQRPGFFCGLETRVSNPSTASKNHD